MDQEKCLKGRRGFTKRDAVVRLTGGASSMAPAIGGEPGVIIFLRASRVPRENPTSICSLPMYLLFRVFRAASISDSHIFSEVFPPALGSRELCPDNVILQAGAENLAEIILWSGFIVSGFWFSPCITKAAYLDAEDEAGSRQASSAACAIFAQKNEISAIKQRRVIRRYRSRSVSVEISNLEVAHGLLKALRKVQGENLQR